MNIDLSGKTALVTGSTAGIGYAIANGLAASGAAVVVNGRGQGKVDAAVARLKQGVSGAKVRGIAADVSTAEGCAALLKALPDVDILINNAGIFEPKNFFKIPDEDWSRFFEVNVMSGVRLSRAYLAGMLKRNWGPHRFHLLRIRAEHPDRDDPLRHDQDRTTRGRARARKADARHGGDSEFGAAGTYHVGWR